MKKVITALVLTVFVGGFLVSPVINTTNNIALAACSDYSETKCGSVSGCSWSEESGCTGTEYKGTSGSGSGELDPVTGISLWDALDTVVSYLFGLLIIVATIFLVVAGILFVTAQGDPDKVKKARDFVLWALIGVIVGVLAYVLVNFVQGMVGAGD